MLGRILPPYTSMQELNLDWILTKVKNILRFVPDDGAVGQILRRTAHGAEWSNEQGGGGAVDSVNGQTGTVVLTASDVGALPDTYTAPVDSVNGQTGMVVLSIPTDTSDLTNNAGFVDSAGAASAAPVQSVNGQTGAVVLGKSDVGLGNVDNVQQYSASNPPPYPVTSVNGQTGAAVLSIPSTASDVGAINPPDIVNAQRTALTSGTALNVTSTGAWYCVAAINRNTSGDCWATIADQNLNVYYAAIQSPTGNFTRALTPWLYFPAGAEFAARASFTYSDTSGLFKAQPLT